MTLQTQRTVNAPATLSDEQRRRVSDALENAQSVNARRNYAGQFRKFRDWCEREERSPLPASPEVVAETLRGLTRQFGANQKQAKEVPYEAPTKGSFRYRLDESPTGLTMYLDKDSVRAERLPLTYREKGNPIMTVDSSVNCSLRYYKAYIAEPGTVCAELDLDSGLLVEETSKSWNAMGEIPESHDAEVVVQGHPRTASVVVKILRLYKECSIARGQECGLLLVGFDPEIDLPFESYVYIPRIVIQTVVEEEYFEDDEDDSYTLTSVSFVDGEVRSMLRLTWEPHPTEKICYVVAMRRF